MRFWVITAILIVVLVIQTTIFPFFKIYNVMPDLMITVVVSFALLASPTTGMIIGFYSGILQDIMFGSIIGLNALIYMVAGYLVSYIFQGFYKDKVLVPLSALITGIIVKELLMLVSMFFMRLSIDIKTVILKIMIPELIYSALFMIINFNLISKLYKYKFMTKRIHFDFFK